MKKYIAPLANDEFTKSYLDIPEHLRAIGKGSHTVYKLTSPDGKVYIGQTSCNLPRRCQRGKNYKRNPELTADIQQYGWDNFTLEILRENISGRHADIIERLAIVHYHALFPDGYNKERGGIRGHNSFRSKPVFQIDPNTGEIIALWESHSAARRTLKIKSGDIGKAAADKIPSAGGYIWKNATVDDVKEWNRKESDHE